MSEREDAVHSAAAEPWTARPQDAADYIAELAAELAELARNSRLDFLASLLDMSQVEAADTAKRLGARTRR